MPYDEVKLTAGREGWNEMGKRSVVVVRLQWDSALEELKACRDYVLTSIVDGCLALNAGMEYSIEEFPSELGDVRVQVREPENETST